jgi:metacaspase-1
MQLLLCFLLLITGIPVLAQKEPEKLALIVAISNYAPSTGWNKLNAENDIPCIKETRV